MNILRLSTFSLTIVLFTIGVLVLPVNTALAHCTGKGSHTGEGCEEPHGGGGDDGGGDDPMYDVTISQDVMAQSKTPWSEGGKRNSIGGSDRDDDFFTTLGVLVNGGPDSFDGAHGAVCFAAGSFPLYAGGIAKGKQGRAEGQFWFFAKTYVEDLTLLYQVRFIGEFDGAWPPVSGVPSNITMNEWRLTATNEGDDIKSISCIGEGTGVNVIITVTEL